MSLDNIQLPPFVIQDLYKSFLVELEPGKPKQAPPLEGSSLAFLGNNRQKILIIVNNEEALYLPHDQLTFLLGILSACKLSMEDVAIVNINKEEAPTYLGLTKELKAERIFLFGVRTAQIALPLQIPDYQVQAYNNQVYLSAPELTILQNDKTEKTKLWGCLKQIFSIQ